MFISFALLLGSAIITALDFFTGNFSLPTYIPYKWLQDSVITKFNYIAVISSVFLILLYTSIIYLFINVEFEKTQSTEVIFFSLFLMGCLTESTRLLFPVLNLWNQVNIIPTLCTRAVIFGRVTATVALLLTVICSSPDYRQYVEQNILISVSGAMIIALLLPLNTSVIYPVGLVSWGFGKILRSAMITILIAAVISQYLKSFISTNKTIALATGILMISIGYYFLCATINYLFLGLGFVFLMSGTILYLKTLHRQYLWT